MSHDVGGIAGDRLKSFIERIESLLDDRASVQGDIKDVYAEAKSTGFDVKIMRQVIKLRAMTPEDRDEQAQLLELYRDAIGGL